MSSALVGATGFVGGNLLRQRQFEDLYHSRNIDEIRGRSYSLLVCAAGPAEKWKANRDPEQDRQRLWRLTDALRCTSAHKVVLISTIDVYPFPVTVDETTPIQEEQGHPYGKHRLALEQFVRAHFDTLIVRLPGLFAPGLKKNVIYDFLHDKNLDQIHSDSIYQFYDLTNLWSDIRIALDCFLDLVNFATEPLAVRELAQAAFDIEFVNYPSTSPACYDFRSIYAALYGGESGYLYNRVQILSAMRNFVESQREGAQRREQP